MWERLYNWFYDLPRKSKAVIITGLCLLLCLAVLVGILVNMRSARQDYVDRMMSFASSEYNLVMFHANSILRNYSPERTDTYSFSDMLHRCRNFSIYFMNLLELTDIREVYPTAVSWLLELSLNVSAMSESELVSVPLQRFNKYYTVLQRAQDRFMPFEETMSLLEADLEALPADYFES